MSGRVFESGDTAAGGAEFRRVLETGSASQLVSMRLRAGEEIGEEVHEHGDQILPVVAGEADVVLDGERTRVGPTAVAFIPAGTRHNVIQAGDADLRLLSIYAPPEHKPGTVHSTRSEAEAAEHDH